MVLINSGIIICKIPECMVFMLSVSGINTCPEQFRIPGCSYAIAEDGTGNEMEFGRQRPVWQGE